MLMSMFQQLIYKQFKTYIIMKKLLFAILMAFSVTSNAHGLEKGYRGNVEAGYCHYISQFSPSTIEVTTSHGYQFNPYIFLGAGVGFDYTNSGTWGDVSGKPYNKRDSKVDIPLFFNAKASFTKTKVIPFVDGKIGAYVNNDGNIYATLAIGARYTINNNMGIYLTAGYEVRKVTIQQLHYIAGDKYNGYKGEFYYTDRTGEPVDGFVFKLGIDF